jgi:hypothetical protein
MKKKLGITAVLIGVTLLALAWHFQAGVTVPPGQPALMSLTAGNFGQLRLAFNEAAGDVRIVVLLSPT